MQTQPALVASLVDNAVRLSATIGRVLLRLEAEAHTVDFSGIEDEGPSTDSLIEKARLTAAEDNHPSLMPPAFFMRRLADITTRTWLQQARSSRRHPRPDVLGLTCRVPASTADPESYLVARFVVILALRALTAQRIQTILGACSEVSTTTSTSGSAINRLADFARTQENSRTFSSTSCSSTVESDEHYQAEILRLTTNRSRAFRLCGTRRRAHV